MGDGFDTWKKGGLRQSALEAAVPEYLAPARIGPFFVATEKRRIFPWSSLNPLALFRREFVLVIADDKLLVLGLKRPAIFRATIASVESETALPAPTIEWTGGSLRVDGKRYFPIPFHDEDAASVASRCQPSQDQSTAR
jgi:hypothetical protein